MYNYGLVCISEVLKAEDKSCAFQTMTRKRYNDLLASAENGDIDYTAQSVLEERIEHNLRITQQIIQHCADNDIYHYRLSSKLFPLVTDPTLGLDIAKFSNYSVLLEELKKIGEIADECGVSISIHPDQFNVLASTNPNVVNKTIDELNFHAHIMDLIGLPQDYTAPINIHPSTSTNNPTEDNLRQIVDRFYEGYKRCSEGVRKRLVVENEDKGCWNCANLFMYFHNYCGTKHGHFFPLTYDNLHDHCNPSHFQGNKVTQAQNVQAFVGTWKNVIPVFHFSWGKADKLRSHADYADENIPQYDVDITWEIELKQKDYAIFRLLGKEVEEPVVEPDIKPEPEAKEPEVEEPEKQKEPEILKNLESTDNNDNIYTAYNHVYGINRNR